MKGEIDLHIQFSFVWDETHSVDAACYHHREVVEVIAKSSSHMFITDPVIFPLAPLRRKKLTEVYSIT